MSGERNWNIGNVTDWEPIALDVPIAFNVTGMFRNVLFDFISDEIVVCECVGTGENVLAVGMGLNTVKFATSEDVAVSFRSDVASAKVYIRSKADTQMLVESADASHVIIQPPRSGPSAEIARMMHLVQLNSKRREEALMGELKRMRGTADGGPPRRITAQGQVIPEPSIGSSSPGSEKVVEKDGKSE